MFDGIRSLFSHLSWLVKNEAKQGLIHLAKYVIARCEGAPSGARREPLPPPLALAFLARSESKLAGGENKELPPVEPPPVKRRPRRQVWN